VRLADAGGAEQDDVLLARDEAELVQVEELAAVDGGLEGEVEGVERLERRQAGRVNGGGEATLAP
jgi:hypothetical protein